MSRVVPRIAIAVVLAGALGPAACALLGDTPCAVDQECGDDAACREGFCVAGAPRADGGAHVTADGGALHDDDAGFAAADAGFIESDAGFVAVDGGFIASDGGFVIVDGGVIPLDGGFVAGDAGFVVDAGQGVDGGGQPTPDGGAVVDAGNVDAGGVVDAGNVDAGAVVDAGIADAGAIVDAGIVDAGAVVDAGSVADAGSRAAICGDGHVDPPETCDDGTVYPAKGCDACQVAVGQECWGAPSICAPTQRIVHVYPGTTIASAQTQLLGPGLIVVHGQDVRTECLTVTFQLGLVAVGGETLECGTTQPTIAVTDTGRLALQGFTVRRVIGGSYAARTLLDVASGGEASVTRTTFGYTLGTAIVANPGSTFDMHASAVKGGATGLWLNTAGWTVESSIFATVGTVTGGGAAIRIDEGNGTFQFNTIINTLADVAVDCVDNTVIFASIIAGSSGADFGANPFLSSSNFPTAAAANVPGDPKVDVYGRILPGSVCQDAVDFADASFDVELDARPANGLFDCGADEIP